MRKLLSLTAAAAVLAGCTTTAPMQTYRPANYGGSAWAIDGTLHEGTNEHVLRINGQQVAAGSLGLMATGTVHGEYEGRPVRSECSPGRMKSAYVQATVCRVYVDNELAATLQF